MLGSQLDNYSVVTNKGIMEKRYVQDQGPIWASVAAVQLAASRLAQPLLLSYLANFASSLAHSTKLLYAILHLLRALSPPPSSCLPSTIGLSIPPSGEPSWEDTELRQIHQSAPFAPESWVTVVRSGCIVPIDQPWCHSWDLQKIDWATLCCQV